MHEFLSWLRFVEYDENITLIYQYKGAAINAAKRSRKHSESDSDEEDENADFKAKDLPPLSIKNEKKVLNKIHLLAKTKYDNYPTSVEEDVEILKKEDLTFNQRNCVQMRHGEKTILVFLMQMTEVFLKMIDLDFKAAKKEHEALSLERQEGTRDYVTHCLLHLIKKGT